MFGFGRPYVVTCPVCGKKIVTEVDVFGSGAFSCNCGMYEPIRFDFVSDEDIKKNQEKYNDIIETWKRNNM